MLQTSSTISTHAGIDKGAESTTKRRSDLRFFQIGLKNIQKSIQTRGKGDGLESLTDSSSSEKYELNAPVTESAVEAPANCTLLLQDSIRIITELNSEIAIEDEKGDVNTATKVLVGSMYRSPPVDTVSALKYGVAGSTVNELPSSLLGLSINENQKSPVPLYDKESPEVILVDPVKSILRTNTPGNSALKFGHVSFGSAASSFGAAPALNFSPVVPTQSTSFSSSEPLSSISSSFTARTSLFGGQVGREKSIKNSTTDPTPPSLFAARNPAPSISPTILNSSSSTLNSCISSKSLRPNTLTFPSVTVTTTLHSGIAVSVKEVHSVPISSGFVVPRSINTTGQKIVKFF